MSQLPTPLTMSGAAARPATSATSGAPPDLLQRVEHCPGSEVVSLRLWVRGGAVAESTPGLAALTGRMLMEGTAHRNWEEIALACEERGASLSSAGGFETIGLAIDCLAEDWRFAVDLASELLLQSDFPVDRFDWQRQQAISELQSLADQPEVLSSWAFMDQLYHPHALARPLLGSAETLRRLSADACGSFHEQSLRRGGWIVIAGAVDPEEVTDALGEAFAPAIDSAAMSDDGPATESEFLGRDARRQEVPLPDSQQLHLYAGHLTVERLHPDAAALEVLGVVLGAGNGLNGRFPRRLREKEGLGYVAHAHAIAGASRMPGRFVVYLGTGAEHRERAERAILEELDRLLQHGITSEEFDDARNFLLGREAMRRETVAQRADLLSESIFYQKPWNDLAWAQDRYRSLEHEQVEAACRRWLKPSDLRWTIGVPASVS